MTETGLDDSEDGEDVDRADDFENKYNFRFEEVSPPVHMSHTAIVVSASRTFHGIGHVCRKMHRSPEAGYRSLTPELCRPDAKKLHVFFFLISVFFSIFFSVFFCFFFPTQRKLCLFPNQNPQMSSETHVPLRRLLHGW